ncbi:hypothetical protein L207DRAFT_538383 [Hyaloscypha variabilis F]|uniref:Uncharacterized protein n=1 Tax=Hyaloscypha variabilis (strain UAMH 11265 / GT02V1 / F) TaxID=1149755 RepID=A0A2J6QUI5_HYAVF|nr:hypothetical protein L207DRAFT_538383 [Hyaloscypha variabilis F]
MSKKETVVGILDSPCDTVGTETKTKKTKRFSKFVGPLLTLVLCLGWMAPIVALLVLNFKDFIIGASVSCAVRSCNDNGSADNATKTSEILDEQDHEILGALQLVAKALEVWFIFIAGSLVFDLTMLLARRGNGIPIRYFMVPLEFSELKSFISKSLFTSAFPRHTNTQPDVHGESIPGSKDKRTKKTTIFFFLLFVVAVSIVCNLMGPATAVLLIPSLVWRIDPLAANGQAVTSISASGTPINLSGNCSTQQIASGQYSCAGDQQECWIQESSGYDDSCAIQGGVLDAMLLELELQGTATPFVQLETNVRFSLLNGEGAQLVPSLQTLADLDDDYLQWVYAGVYNYTIAVDEYETVVIFTETFPPSLYDNLRNAQQVQLQRQGPGYFSESYCESQMPYYYIEIAANQMIRCYESQYLPGYLPLTTTGNSSESPVSTMCIRTGSGWGGSQLASQFFVANSTSPSSRPVTVNTYSSDTAIYLDSTNYYCASDNATTGSAKCDWGSLFSAEPSSLIKNLTINPSVVEYIWSDGITVSWCLTSTFLRYPTYILDASPTTNPLNIVSLFDNGPLTTSDEPIFVHPDWSLVGWVVDRGATITVDQPRAQVLENFLTLEYSTEIFFSSFQDVVSARILSLIDYVTEASSADHSPTPLLPILSRSIRVYVYAYNLQSRTSILGVVVAISGILIVLIKMLFGVIVYTKKRDALEFLEIALEQEPPGIFVPPEEAENLGNVRFRFGGDDGKEEEPKFQF